MDAEEVLALIHELDANDVPLASYLESDISSSDIDALSSSEEEELDNATLGLLDWSGDNEDDEEDGDSDESDEGGFVACGGGGRGGRGLFSKPCLVNKSLSDRAESVFWIPCPISFQRNCGCIMEK